MKRLIIILVLCCSITLTFGCSKDNGKILEKEELINDNIDKGDNELPMNTDAETIVYKDDVHGFSLELPYSWKGNYIIEKELWIDGINQSVEFNFKKDGITSNIFTIIVMNESILHEDWEDLFLMYIVEKDGKTFSYLNVMEPTEELLKNENKEELETVTRMVEEVPDIIETFSLEK